MKKANRNSRKYWLIVGVLLALIVGYLLPHPLATAENKYSYQTESRFSLSWGANMGARVIVDFATK